MRGEAVGHAAGPDAGIAPSKDIHRGVANDGRLLGTSFRLFKQRARAFGIGFLGGKAVASVHVEEKLAQPKGFDDCTRGMNWFVGKYRHLPSDAVQALNRSQALPDAVVDVGMVKFVYSVVGEKIVQCFFQELLVFRIAEGAPHQHGSAISDVGSDHFTGQLGPPKMPEHGIDGMNQVEPRINQGAVKVEDQQLDRTGIELAVEFDHRARAGFRINDEEAISTQHSALSQIPNCRFSSRTKLALAKGTEL